MPKSFEPNEAYIIAWYGRTVSIDNDIKVRVFFVKNNQEFYTCALIPIAIIPQVPIGSIWINGRSKSKLIKGNLPLVSFRDIGDENSYENTVVYDNINNQKSTVFAALKSNYHINIIEDKGRGKERTPVFIDGNTLLNVQVDIGVGLKTLAIHPLTFLQTHYSVSKSISNLLFQKLWPDIEESLYLDYTNPAKPEAVFIPDNLLVADAVFLYHLKNDSFAKNVVRALHHRVRQNFINNKNQSDNKAETRSVEAYSYLRVTPFHDQPVHLSCNYIEINEQILLCTEITGISMPQGYTVFYDVDRPNRSMQNKDGYSLSRSVNFVYHDLQANDVILCEGPANNKNITLVKQQLQTVGEAKRISLNQNISLENSL